MYHFLRWSLIGHLDLEARLHPLSLAGQFQIGANASKSAEPQNRLQILGLIIGAILVLPAALALGFGALKFNLGWPYWYDAAFSSSVFVVLASASLFLGTPLALLLNFLAILRMSLVRRDGRITTSVTLEPTLWHLVILGFAFNLSALFFGHLFVDALACFRGVKSAC